MPDCLAPPEYLGEGVHDAISPERYHADPAPEPSLSSGVCKIILNATLAHARGAHPRLNQDYEPSEGKREFDLGSAVHALLLEGGTGIHVLRPEDFPAKNGNIPKGYTNDAIRAARDAIYDHRGIPLLPEQWQKVQKMASAVRRQIAEHEEMADWLDLGKSEQTLIWKDRKYGFWCRARLDRMPKPPNRIFGDLKTVGQTANPYSITNYVTRMGWDIQDAFYRRGIVQLGLCKKPKFRFVAVEAYPPFCLSVIGISPQDSSAADAKVDHAMSLWARALETDKWPGYPNKTCFIEFPPWAHKEFDERAAIEQAHLSQEFYRP